MRKILWLTGILFYTSQVEGQVLPLGQLLPIPSLPAAKSANYISQKGFVLVNTGNQEDTVTHTYYYRGKGREAGQDSTERMLLRQTIRGEVLVTYATASAGEFNILRQQLQEAGFIRENGLDSLPSFPRLYQQKDITITVFTIPGEVQALFALRVQKNKLPAAREIRFAEDLLAFRSHTNLAYVFGDKNVRKDLYYFSEKEFSRCSVLFPNTDRQAVFIWQDEQNDRNLVCLVLGGQLTLQGSAGYQRPVAENSWVLKSRVRAGMNLRQLRQLNGADFRFHHVNSVYSGMIIPGKEDKIDFLGEQVILACMNCSDMKEAGEETISADEAIAAGRSFFVFSIMLYPPGLAGR